MAKIEFAAALSLLSFFSVAAAASSDNPTFSVAGRVYCDTCRAGFETNATEYISGAKVKIECRHFAAGSVEQSGSGVTDSAGEYRVEIAGDREEEICEVALVGSPVADCKEIGVGRDRAEVVLSADGGMSGGARVANSLGFLRDEPLPGCEKLLKEYYGQEEEA